jgi:hypothetical protein
MSNSGMLTEHSNKNLDNLARQKMESSNRRRTLRWKSTLRKQHVRDKVSFDLLLRGNSYLKVVKWRAWGLLLRGYSYLKVVQKVPKCDVTLLRYL